MFTQHNGLKDNISPLKISDPVATKPYQNVTAQLWLINNKGCLSNSGSAHYRPRRTLNQLQKGEQTNKIYADKSTILILICYPQLEQVFSAIFEPKCLPLLGRKQESFETNIIILVQQLLSICLYKRKFPREIVQFPSFNRPSQI